MDYVIALPVDSIIYAPLFIAKEAGYFLDRDNPIQFAKIRKSISKEAGPLSGATQFFFPVLTDIDHRAILTVCDPMHALLFNATRGTTTARALVLGTLVRGPACWFFDSVVTNEDQLVRSIKGKELTSILTHPRLFTADTLTRWLLSKHSIDPAIVNNLEEPGDELGTFNSEVPHAGSAAVSVDVLRMQYLEEQTGGHHGIRYDFGVNGGLKNYLMTALVANHDVFHKHSKEIENVINGIDLALRLITDAQYQDHCWHLLHLHYKNRHSNGTKHIFRSPHLEPLKTVPPDHERYLRKVFEFRFKSHAKRIYPQTVKADSLDEALPFTLDIYGAVQQDQLMKAGVTSEKLRTRLAELVDTSKKRSISTAKTVSYLRELCVELKNQVISADSPHHLALEVAQWVRGLGEELALWQYQIFEGYVCYDVATRNKLLNQIGKLSDWIKSPDEARSPFAAMCVAKPGSGKTSFLNSLRDRFVEERKISQVRELKRGDYSNVDSFGQALVTRLKEIAPSASSQKPALIIIDEINKTPYVLNTFLTSLDMSCGPTESLSGMNIKKTALIWLFAGAYDSVTELKTTLMPLKDEGGPDWVRRLQDNYFEIPGQEPYENILKCVAMAGIDSAKRPDSIQARLLFALAFFPFRDAGDMSDAMKRAVNKMQDDRILRIEHLWHDDRWRRFALTYGDALESLSDVPIKIAWQRPYRAGGFS